MRNSTKGVLPVPDHLTILVLRTYNPILLNPLILPGNTHLSDTAGIVRHGADIRAEPNKLLKKLKPRLTNRGFSFLIIPAY
jgi:hypothetical protein